MEIKNQVTVEELSEVARSLKILENGNWNSEATLLLAQTVGTDEDIQRAQEILVHGKDGFKGADPKLEERRQLKDRLLGLFEKLLKKNGIELNDISLGKDEEKGGVWLSEEYSKIGGPVQDWLKRALI